MVVGEVVVVGQSWCTLLSAEGKFVAFLLLVSFPCINVDHVVQAWVFV